MVSMIKPGTMKNRRFETSSNQTKDFIKLVHVAFEHLSHIIKDIEPRSDQTSNQNNTSYNRHHVYEKW